MTTTLWGPMALACGLALPGCSVTPRATNGTPLTPVDFSRLRLALTRSDARANDITNRLRISPATAQPFRPRPISSAIVCVRLASAERFNLSLARAKPVGARPAGENGRPWRWNVQFSAKF